MSKNNTSHSKRYFMVLSPNIERDLKRGWSPTNRLAEPLQASREKVVSLFSALWLFSFGSVTISDPDYHQVLENGVIKVVNWWKRDTEVIKEVCHYIGEIEKDRWVLVDPRYTQSLGSYELHDAKTREHALIEGKQTYPTHRDAPLPKDAVLFHSDGFRHLFEG